MHLSRLTVRTFRNLSNIDIRPTQGLNLFYGSNASGKTSILESLYILGHGRSFRSRKLDTTIQTNKNEFVTYGEILHSETSKSPVKIGVRKENTKKIISRINGLDNHNSSNLASNLPIILITPESFRLISEGPEIRREYIDWLLFHVEHTFHSAWLTYTRVLKQRNALLKSHTASSELDIWNQQLITVGDELNRLRISITADLISTVLEYLDKLSFSANLSMHFRSGWSKETTFTEAINKNIQTDLQLGYTTVGPHRAELVMSVDNHRAIDVLSRGQQKLLICALKLAQLTIYTKRNGMTPIVMIDDIAAELDEENRNLLLTTLMQLKTQTFVTSIKKGDINLELWPDHKVFHVEHGYVKVVV